jgi:hypothetical protein
MHPIAILMLSNVESRFASNSAGLAPCYSRRRRSLLELIGGFLHTIAHSNNEVLS